MPDVIQERVEQYRSAFQGYIDGISALSVPPGCRYLKKTLCLSVVEALAAGRYPKKNPKDRFVSLVLNHGGWPDATRISLVHLVAALERADDDRLQPAREHFYDKLSRWGSGGPLFVSACDIEWSEAQRHWPHDMDPLVGRLLLRNLRLVELLYDYRSFLVHEAREATASFEGSETLPFYESLSCLTDDGIPQEWHLVFPFRFLHDLARECLASLCEYYLSNGQDPYERYQFGHYLRPELNDISRYPIVHPCSASDPES